MGRMSFTQELKALAKASEGMDAGDPSERSRLSSSAAEDRFASVMVEEDVAISKRDQPDVVTERGLGGEVL